MTTQHILALAGYFLILAEFIAMRHRDICAKSDAMIDSAFDFERTLAFLRGDIDRWEDKATAQAIYWNRGTK